jgi:DNA-binding HxlR family transcriptional regulator
MPRRPSGEERGLELLRSETNRSILTALKRAPSTEAELRAWLVLRDGKKLGRHLKSLLAAGAIERQRLGRASRRVEYSLTDLGDAPVQVIAGVEGWLDRHPDRHLQAVSPIGWRAFALLVDAWVGDVAKQLAQGPRSLGQLAAETGVSAARLSGDLVALQGAGIVATVDSDERGGSVYLLSEWGILGIGVLALSSYWQREVEEHPIPVSVDDTLIALAAGLPLVTLPASESGTCALTVEPDGSDARAGRSGALHAEVREGAVSANLGPSGHGPPDAWARGTINDWLLATVAGRRLAIHWGGRQALAAALVAALHTRIYGG